MQENSKEDEPGNLYKIFNFKNDSKTGLEYILNIIKKAKDEGMLDGFQSNIMEKSLMFPYITVSDIMTHRVDIKAVSKDVTLKELISVCLNSGFSRIPVYEKDIDNIVGLIYVKDLLKLIFEKDNENKNIHSFIRDIPFITESMKCVDLLYSLTKNHKHLAVVVDEYGGTSGIVSLEDVVEVVFGEIQDEYDNESDKIIKTGDNIFILQGGANLKDVAKVLNIDIEKTQNYDTIGGFLVDRIGSVPEEGEKPVVVYSGIKFKILSVNKQHIEKVEASKID